MNMAEQIRFGGMDSWLEESIHAWRDYISFGGIQSFLEVESPKWAGPIFGFHVKLRGVLEGVGILGNSLKS